MTPKKAPVYKKITHRNIIYRRKILEITNAFNNKELDIWKKKHAYKVFFDDKIFGISRNQSEKQRIQNTGNPSYSNLTHSQKCAAQSDAKRLYCVVSNGGEKGVPAHPILPNIIKQLLNTWITTPQGLLNNITHFKHHDTHLIH